MIDKNGKKIIESGKQVDLEFSKKEIAFFMKGFIREYSDQKAFMIAKMIYDYLKSGGSRLDTYDHVELLEKYVSATDSDDFLWNLVYIRRFYATKLIDIDEYEWAAKHRRKSAELFEDICRVNPSWHNRNIRVWEYSVAALYAFDHRKIYEVSSLINTVLNRAEELFGELESMDSENYYDTGRLLYYCRMRYLQKIGGDSGEQFLEYLSKLTYFGRELYRSDKSSTTYLGWMIGYYENASKYKEFILREGDGNIRMIYEEVEELNKKNGLYSSYAEKLRKLKDIYSVN